MSVNRPARPRPWFLKSETILALLFLLTLPLINPWVRGDGVGYYAYARALLIEHSLDFTKDWLEANPTFRMGRVDEAQHIRLEQYTRTGHLDNHFTVGPAMLWAPFLVATHLAVLGFDHLGGHVRADGFSMPYIVVMAGATALYGFLGLLLSFRLARKYVEERWAFLATLGIWFASSLPVYMYFNPSWSHAHSAFAVALFLWYWDRTREARTPRQWLVLGLLGGFLIDVYYPNAVFLLVPVVESLRTVPTGWQKHGGASGETTKLLLAGALYGVAILVGLTPTLVTRAIIYGSPFSSGYVGLSKWNWTRPDLWNVLFSSDHGLLSWTPILIPASLGLIALFRRDSKVATPLLVTVLTFYYLTASYPDWDGLSSFGNRLFASVTSVFVIGLGAALDALGKRWQRRRTVTAWAYGVTAVLIAWNLGFIFQWGTHMIPVRGPISWREMARNQFTGVPVRVAGSMKNYLLRRKELMGRIEQEDIKQLESQKPPQK